MSKPEPTVTHTMVRDDGTTYEVQVPRRLIRRYKRLCTSMRGLLKEFQEHAPDGGLYLEGEGHPYLMVGSSHIGYRANACQENILASGTWWPHSGGGGW